MHVLVPFLIAVAGGGASVPSGSNPGSTLATFVLRHCADCHDDTVQKGNLDLTALTLSPGDPDNLRRWVRVHDQVRAGEMPPPGKGRPRPPRAETAAALVEITGAIVRHEQAVAAGQGRSSRRRLNAYEYEHVLRDLFQAPWLQVRAKLPEDGEAFGCNKVGDALDVSHVFMARAMRVAEYAMKQVISTALDRPPLTLRRYYARDQRSLTSFATKLFSPAMEKRMFPLVGIEAQPEVRKGNAPKTVGDADPATRDREAVGMVISNFVAGASFQWDEFRAPVAGRYRVRFSGYTVWVGPGVDPPRSPDGKDPEGKPWRSRKHLPNYDEVSRGRRDEPAIVYTRGGVGNRRVGAFDLTPEPAVHDLGELYLVAGEQLAPDPARLFRRRGVGDIQNPLMQPDGAPAVAFRWMEVEGPLPEEPAPAGYRLLFDDLPVRRVATGDEPKVAPEDPKDRTTRGGSAKEALEGVTFEVVSADPRRDAERLMRGFLARAYRRPVAGEELRLFLGVVEGRLEAGQGFTEAMLAGYTAVLTSPGFLYVDAARPGPLEDHALAERLALFLWSSAPDDRLRALAACGALRAPEVLRAETDRLLDDPRSRRFVDSFLDYWIDARHMEATTPSGTLYNDYEWDMALREAALEESQRFFADLVARDLPARNVVAARHTFLNERLARHYGLPGVMGVALRRVTLPSRSVRGGFLTQATVLKVTANGTTTSPVLRGKWVVERILGEEVPPPPPVAAVDPDIRGAVTIRQQLDKHRADPSCASCHARIDPPGFALESFDVFGGWRERYRVLDDKLPRVPGRGKDGVAFTFALGPPVDPAGALPDGRAFADIQGLRRLLLGEEDRVARNLVRRLVVYATGAPVRFSDRGAVEAILNRTRRRGYGVRSLVHAIVDSGLFREK